MKTRLNSTAAWWHSVNSIILLASLTSLGWPASIRAASRQSTGWLVPQALSSEAASSWFPDIAADRSGQIHVAWSTSVSAGVGNAYDVVMYSVSRDGALWSPTRDIIALPSVGAVTRPNMLADDKGFLHLTFRSFTVYYTRAPLESVAPNTLLRPNPMSAPENTNNAYFSRLAIDQLQRLHLIYTENIQSASCQGCMHIFYRQSDDNGLTWTKPADISRLAAGSAKPQLISDAHNNLYIAWESGLGGDLGQLDQTQPTQVMFMASYDRGQTWTDPINLAAVSGQIPSAATTTALPSATPRPATPANGRPTPTATQQPATPTPAPTPQPKSFKNIALGMDGKGNLVVAWLALPEDRVYYQLSSDQGRSWSNPQLIPGVWGAWSIYQGRTDDYAMVTDSAGVVQLVLVGRTAEKQDSLSVLHVSWDGTSWSEPEAITTLTGDVPEWPRAAVGLGNILHVVWFVRDQAHIFGGAGASQYRIWYSQTRLPAPAQTPVVWPTLAAAVTASAMPSLTPPAAPTPGITASAAARPTPGLLAHTDLVYNEMDYLRVVAVALIPALLVLLIVVGTVFIGRR
jgi:hypothetical protein